MMWNLWNLQNKLHNHFLALNYIVWLSGLRQPCEGLPTDSNEFSLEVMDLTKMLPSIERDRNKGILV